MTGSNFHTHTVFCDGADTPEELVQYAISKGSPAIGFSGHSYTDIPDDDPFCMGREAAEAYKQEINRLKSAYKDKIKILLGVEQDYYSDEPADGYDYVIGSVHYVLKDGFYIPVDETKEKQAEAVDRFYNGDFYAFCEDYYGLAGDLYSRTKCDIVGHFDLVTKFNEGNALFDTNNPRYIAASDRALKKLMDSPAAFEINFGAVAAGLKKEPYPEKRIIKNLAASGKDLLYSSDCHKKELLLFGIPECQGIFPR